jgi:hypothetical protein
MLRTLHLGRITARLLHHRLVLLTMLIAMAYLLSIGSASALPPAPGRIPNGNVYSCGTCHQSGHSSGVPATPAHGDAMRNPYLNTTPSKTWTTALANQDSDGDGFTNGEELQDPAGSWAMGQPDPGNMFFVSNPSDENTGNDTPTDECTFSYRATPPAPQLLDIIGYTSPASGDVSFGVVGGRSPLPIDFVRYTVKNSSNTIVYDVSSTSAPFRSSIWNSKAVPDGSYTVTAILSEKRNAAGATPRTSSVSETIVVKNTAPVFGPVGEVVAMPTNPCGIPEALNGIAAISQNDAWAVGTRLVTGPGQQTLIKHWDGVSWTSVISPSANAGNYTSNLRAIAASGASDVWAVGEYNNGNVQQTLIEHWDGTVWKIVPSPNSGSVNTNNHLKGVVALTPSNAWAVGDYDGDNFQGPLILHWNGTSWQSLVVPEPQDGTNIELNAIAAASANDIWAVGRYSTNVGQSTLTMHWNGTAWSIVASPNPNTFLNQLNAVTVLASGQAWAVGHTSDGTGYKTLTMRWNGTSWQVVSSPSPGAPTFENNELSGVAAISANNIWAVGYVGNSDEEKRTLALHWDGTSWKSVARPDTGSTTLNAADALGSTAWAAGTTTLAPGDTQTLVERFWVTQQQQQQQERKVYLAMIRR